MIFLYDGQFVKDQSLSRNWAVTLASQKGLSEGNGGKAHHSHIKTVQAKAVRHFGQKDQYLQRTLNISF